jgi:GNAT superfamily N-acetyltransferase
MQVRRATPEDLKELVDLLRGMHAEVGQASKDEAKAIASIGAAIVGGGVFVVLDEGKIVGTVGLVKSQWWYSHSEAWFSWWFYVAPDYRGGHASRLLLEAVADMVEDDGVSAFIHVFSPGGRVHARWREVGEELGYAHRGSLLAIEPGEE